MGWFLGFVIGFFYFISWEYVIVKVDFRLNFVRFVFISNLGIKFIMKFFKCKG